MPAKLVLTILAVDDLERAMVFYSNAFGWTRTVVTPAYAEYAMSDGMRFGLYERRGFAQNVGQLPARAPEGGVTATELYFYVDDMASAEIRLRHAGARELSPRAIRSWGDEAVYFADLDGNVIVLADRCRA